MNSKIKGITDDITSIPPEEQRYYALNAFPKVLKIGRFNLNEEFIKGFLNDIMKKADKEYVNDELAKKADKEYVNDELGKKADKEYVNDELAKKADKEYVNDELGKKADKEYVNDELAKKADKEYVNDELAKKADKEYVNEIYQSLIGTKNIETIVGDFSVNEENKYFRWGFVQSLRNGIRYTHSENNNEMYVGYIKNNGTQVKVPLDNNCYLNLYGDEQKKYLRVYEMTDMTDMTLSNVAPAPYYYDYGVDAHVDPKKQTLYLEYYRYKRYNAIEKRE
ncbi:phage tail repeat-like family [Trichomonas vaginalis G3]|uniref:phage tail repeat-like family n=1 Tax=Trichomonas vaginalis (strain ATCC PRA-98 / G3) TaxID=412133 RepID=UPI0021E58B5A|nr:phage tail repeat-like family [Trichomonas vaginalis G3]KAI5507130.1 phage tail repeat-like family [Trichomonas vaginalis G3]